MKINLNFKKENIQLGDVLISDNGKYLVVEINENFTNFPISLIDLKTMKKTNGYKDLRCLNSSHHIANGEQIIKVIKSENLVITEEK